MIRGAGNALNTTVGVFTFEGNGVMFDKVSGSTGGDSTLSFFILSMLSLFLNSPHLAPPSPPWYAYAHHDLMSLSPSHQNTIDTLDAQGYSCYSTSRAGERVSTVSAVQGKWNNIPFLMYSIKGNGGFMTDILSHFPFYLLAPLLITLLTPLSP